MRTLAAVALFALPIAGQPTAAQKPDEQPLRKVSRTLIVLNQSAATASLLDPDSGVIRGSVPTGDGPHEVAVSPDGRTAVVANYGGRLPGSTLTVINVLAGRVARTIKLREPNVGGGPRRTLHRPHGLYFLRDGRRVVVTTEQERRLAIVDVGDGEVLATIPTHGSTSHMVACDRTFSRAFVANIDGGSVSVIDLEERELVGVVETGAGTEGIAAHPERDEVWVTSRADDSVIVIDTKTLAVLERIACGKFPIRVAFTPNGQHALVSNAHTGNVAVIDTAKRAIERRITMTEHLTETSPARVLEFGESPVPASLLVRPDGHYAYVANTQAGIVTVLDLRTWRVARRLPAGADPDGIGWSEIRLDK